MWHRSEKSKYAKTNVRAVFSQKTSIGFLLLQQKCAQNKVRAGGRYPRSIPKRWSTKGEAGGRARSEDGQRASDENRVAVGVVASPGAAPSAGTGGRRRVVGSGAGAPRGGGEGRFGSRNRPGNGAADPKPGFSSFTAPAPEKSGSTGAKNKVV